MEGGGIEFRGRRDRRRREEEGVIEGRRRRDRGKGRRDRGRREEGEGIEGRRRDRGRRYIKGEQGGETGGREKGRRSRLEGKKYWLEGRGVEGEWVGYVNLSPCSASRTSINIKYKNKLMGKKKKRRLWWSLCTLRVCLIMVAVGSSDRSQLYPLLPL